MSFTQSNIPEINYTDGTNFATAHPVLDNTGAIISPATAGNQATANSSLSTIATNTAALALETGGNLAAIATNTTGAATAANQATGNSSLSTIATAVQAATPAGGNLIGAVSSQPLISATANFSRPATTGTSTIGWLLANHATAGSVVPVQLVCARGTDIPGELVGLELFNSDVVVTNAIFRVHILNAFGGVSNGDKGAYTLTTATDSLGYFDVTMTEVGASQSIGYGNVMNGGDSIPFKPVSGTNYVYALLEVRAAYALVSGQTFTFRTKTR